MKKQITSKRILNLAASLAALILVSPAFAAPKKTVELPKGSVDGLAAAVSLAGAGGTVIIKQGVHDESGTVTVTLPVTIIGEAGAEIRSGTLPAPNMTLLGGDPSPVTPTIHIQGTHDVRVEGIHFTAAYGAANCSVLIQDSTRVQIARNQVDQFQTGVIVQHGDHVTIQDNVFHIAPLWGDQSNPLALPEYFGVTQGVNVINGKFALIVGNVVTGAGFGLFGNDAHGQMLDNTMEGCLIGVILCHQKGQYSIGGSSADAESVANHWHLANNQATGNFMVGYLVIDGAYRNILSNNGASGNPLDIDLVGTIDYFGILTVFPTCHDNVVAQGSQKGLTVRDCGENNVVSGDVTLIPCPY